MDFRLQLFLVVSALKVLAIDFNDPLQVYAPSISGIGGVIIAKLQGNSSMLFFSGIIDEENYSPNMMIYDYHAVQYSSTTDFPSDRSFYGIVSSYEVYEGYEGYESFNYSIAIVFGGLGPNGVSYDFWAYYIDFDYWLELNVYLEDSAYDFAYASYYDYDKNLTKIYVIGGINNMNNYLLEAYEHTIETEETFQLNDYTECTTIGLAGAQAVYSNNVLYVFTGQYYSYESDLLYYHGLCSLNLNNLENKWVNETIQNTLENSAHGGSCLYKNQIFYFFGSSINYEGFEFSDKIYKLNLDNINEGWKQVEYKCPEDQDCARDSFAFICDNNEVTIFGGNTNNGTTNSMFTIDMEALILNSVMIQTEFPTPRVFATLRQSSTKLLLFGGMNKDEIFNDVWEFEFQTETMSGIWTALAISGSSPLPRYGHAAATQGAFTVYIGGTSEDGRILSDIWILNTISNTWTEIIPSETSDYKIPTITRTCAMLDLPKIYFIGGKTYSGSNFDLWEYDLSINELVRIRKTTSSDIGTHGHACQLIKNNGTISIYTFYGVKNSMHNLYCGIRKLDMTDKNKITVTVIKNKPDYMRCRENFSFSFNGISMLIVGGEVYPDITLNDIWWIYFFEDDYYEETSEEPLYEALSGSAALSFSDMTFIFSGYHDGSFSRNTDISSSLYLLNFDGYEVCGYGYYLFNNYCESCGTGTYKPTNGGECLTCPEGTTNDLHAATHISQCVPCTSGQYFDSKIKECVDCPDGSYCPVGSSEPLNSSVIKAEQQSQPLNFVQPEMGNSLIILGLALGLSIIIFIIIFFTTLLVKITASVHELYRGDHIVPRGETGYDEDRTKISFVGGFFTGLVVITIVFNFGLFLINYYHKNEDETRSLVPAVSLIQDQEYINNHLVLEVYMASYREDCSVIPEISSSFFNLTYSHFDEKSIGNNSYSCTHFIDIDFNELFKSEASIDLFFSSYTSDISITIFGESGNPDAISSYTQILQSTDGDVFKGIDSNIFSFNIMPAYYNYQTLFGQTYESLGFRISPSYTPEIGSKISLDKIYLSTGFKVTVELIMSESGMTTYRFHIMDPISLLILMVASVPGLIELFGMFLRSYEKLYFKWKKIPTGDKGSSVDEQYKKHSKKNEHEEVMMQSLVEKGKKKKKKEEYNE
ncbi:hypothetical protein SteCoe_32259 [Stentor coeruleus]|uniref:Tyrosine-protein kinase ephrin type A/B receptor-like domain-containing protein n=1 Tax=Stentor coeruleus TaxID=5963 RepID=A0A1R2AZE5_9CILI|nr:hypothetical protein SteCoe_32259 [Stentor coeruleus]